MSNDSQPQNLLVRYKNLPPEKYQLLERLVEVGLVRTQDDALVVAQLTKAYKITTSSLVRWKNQGLDLGTISRSLALRQKIGTELYGYGIASESVIALSGFLAKLGSGLDLPFIINPDTKLPELNEIPKEVLIVLDALLSVTLELPGTKYPLQRLLHIVNNQYQGSIRRAYEEAVNDPEGFKQKAVPVRHRPKDLNPIERVSSDYEDQGIDWSDNPEEFIRRVVEEY
jgi:hypothetical protein